MIEVLLAIIAAELGLIMLGFVYRLVIETIIMRVSVKHNQTHGNQLPQGFHTVTKEELREFLKDEPKDDQKTGRYL